MHVAYERSNICRSKQTEGETVRFASLSYDKKGYKTLFSVMISVITLLILGTIGYTLNSSQKDSLEGGDLFVGTSALLIAWIDTIIIYVSFENTKKINSAYQKDMNTIIIVLKSMLKEYPMDASPTNNTFPNEIKELYDILLKRWVNKNNEDTLEDGISSMIGLIEKGRSDILYQYLKFDSGYRDQMLILTSYQSYCTRYRNDKSIQCVPNLQSVLNNLQTYLPTKEYKKHMKTWKSYIIYGIVLFLFLIFPFFHFAYHTMGPGIIGIMSIVIITIASSAGYYMNIFR